jgi:acyl-CoA reductase-like NAD-dependent aldehyde dehydrogenase
MPRFAEEVAERAGGLKLGDGMDETVQVGPLVSEEQRARVEAQVDDAVARGARVLCGGRRPDRPGFFYEPTVVVDVPLESRLMREETFGPVIPVVPYDDLEQAIEWCNDTPFGLSATLWTSDTERAEALARRIHAGSVWINDSSFTHSQAQCPWGGVKASGKGRSHWLGSLHELTTPQLVGSEKHSAKAELWWYPYDRDSVEMFSRFRTFSGEGLLGKILHAPLLLRAYFKVRGSR